MTEKEILREKESEFTRLDPKPYEDKLNRAKETKEKALTGRKVIKGKEIPFVASRQGIARRYVNENDKGVANDNWNIFVHEIREHSGRHVHQGGLNIFVLEGEGYTMVDGIKYNWKAGDIIILPIKKGGVEHQHFNLRNRPSRWLALIYTPYHRVMGYMLRQTEDSPYWKSRNPA